MYSSIKRFAMVASLLCSTSISHAVPVSVLGKLANPAPGVGDAFGSSIVWVGDNVLVGAMGDDFGTLVADTGLAHLYDGDPSSPTFGKLLKVLFSPEISSKAEFASSLSAIGTNAIVGSGFAGTGQFRKGAAYMYDTDPSSPTFGQVLTTFENPRPGPTFDEFGFSSTTIGTNVFIGAYRDGTTAPAAGAVYMFDGDVTSPTFGELTATFENPSPGVADLFGVALTGVGDDRLLVGAFRDDVGGIDAGAAYLFDADPGSATFGALLHGFENPNPSPSGPNGQNDEFGHTVASVGDYVLIGAFRDDAAAVDSGAVYMFNADPASPQFGDLTATFTNPTPAPLENFGIWIESMLDMVLVGAWRAHDQALFGGEVYVFDADVSSAALGELIGVIQNPAPGRFDQFGFSIAVRDNLVGIGALADDGNVGAAHLFSLGPAGSQPFGTLPSRTTVAQAPEPGSALLLSAGLLALLAARGRRTDSPRDGSRQRWAA